MDVNYTTVKENELLPEIARKDRDAFDELYNRFSQVVYNLAFRVVKNKNDAEEVVQEVFVQIWKTAQKYDFSHFLAFFQARGNRRPSFFHPSGMPHLEH